MEGNRIFKQNLKPVIRMRKTIFCDAAVKLTLNIIKTINKLKSWLENVMKGCVLCTETISNHFKRRIKYYSKWQQWSWPSSILIWKALDYFNHSLLTDTKLILSSVKNIVNDFVQILFLLKWMESMLSGGHKFSSKWWIESLLVRVDSRGERPVFPYLSSPCLHLNIFIIKGSQIFF